MLSILRWAQAWLSIMPVALTAIFLKSVGNLLKSSKMRNWGDRLHCEDFQNDKDSANI
jgi:hypothetical protein